MFVQKVLYRHFIHVRKEKKCLSEIMIKKCRECRIHLVFFYENDILVNSRKSRPQIKLCIFFTVH